MRTNAVGTGPELNVSQHFSLYPLKVGEHGQEDERDQPRFDQTDDVEIVHCAFRLRRGYTRVVETDLIAFDNRVELVRISSERARREQSVASRQNQVRPRWTRDSPIQGNRLRRASGSEHG